MGKRKALKIVSVVLLICALVFAAYELFKVRYITVAGCATISEDRIVALSGLEFGEGIFDVDPKKVMDAIAVEPYIKPVSVAVLYPDSVAITIKERKEAACIQKDDALLIIDNECNLLKISEKTENAHCPLVSGISLSEFKVGTKLGASDTFQLDVLSKVLIESEISGISIKSIDVSLTADMVLEIDEGFTVELGDDTNLKNKFKLIISSAAELSQMGKTGGIIDVASATNVYYREK